MPRYPAVAAAETTHGVPFVSAIARQGLVGVQFHPERSGTAGLRLLQNFLRFTDAEAAA
jgi:glutamine amidotransferase